MKTKIIVAFCALLLLRPVPVSAADALTQCILEVLQERLEKTIDKDFKNTEYWQNLLTNVANGTPEAIVQQIMDDYDPNSIAKDTGMKLLERLVPEAAGPIGLLLVANEAVHAYTNYMLDFYKEAHYQRFSDEVLKPSKTTAELKANYNKFKEVINAGEMDAAVAYADRAAQEERFYNAFLQAFGALAKAERAAAARASAQKIITRKFKVMRAEAASQVEIARDYLLAAAMPVEASSVKRFLANSANNDFANAVRSAAKKAGQKQAEKKDAAAGTAQPKTGDTASGGTQDPQPKTGTAATGGTQPKTGGATGAKEPKSGVKTDPVVVVPPQPGSGPIGNSIRLLNAGEESEDQRTLDYSQYYSAYKDAADKLVFGDMAPTVYSEATSNIYAGAHKAYLNCLGASGEPGKSAECRSAFERFSSDAAQINSNVSDLARQLREELEGDRKRLLDARKPSEKLAEIQAAMAGDMRRAKEDRSCQHEITMNTAQQAAKNIEACKGQLGFLATFIDQLEAKTKEFQDFCKAFDENTAKDFSAYADRYSSSYNLAAFSGAQLDSYLLKNLSDDSARAQSSLGTSYAPLGEGVAGELRRSLAAGTRHNREAETQLGLNQAFIEMGTPLAGQAENQFTALTKGGKKADFRSFNGREYYDQNFKELFENFFSGALTLLSPKTRGSGPDEYMSYKQGSIKVWDAEKYPFYKSLAEHAAVLKEFTEKTEALKEMELERRHRTLDEILKKTAPEAAKIKSKTLDAQELARTFDTAAKVRDNLAWNIKPAEYFELFYGTGYTLSAAVMDRTLETYSKELEEIKAIEQNAIAVFGKYTNSPVPMEKEPKELSDARTPLNCKKWRCSQALWKAYNDMKAAEDRLTVAAMQKNSPVSGLSINGKPIPQRASYSIEMGDADLVNGELVIKGGIYPGAVASLSALELSLDCKNYPISLTPAESFTHAFRPQSGQRYCIRVKPSIGDLGRLGAAATWPAEGDYFTVEYVKGSQDEVRSFYDKFRAAYEGRNAPQVLALVSGGWSAGDGTELSDLEENLRNNFRLYDEIKYDMAALRVSRTGRGWQACYDVTITSRIFKRNLKHEEKSQVCDEVGDDGGKFKLLRTYSGSYWYVK